MVRLRWAPRNLFRPRGESLLVSLRVIKKLKELWSLSPGWHDQCAIQETCFWHRQLEIENNLIAIYLESCERLNSATKPGGFSFFSFEILGGSFWNIVLFDQKVQKLE
jgi:hypothetical protein